ncbi:acyltransferase, partial [Salmonella enterica subsp. enterica serovar Typhimurium]|nr:acyltransferase [Salmonella enterica subsp. enterica serovar Typhimurium]
MEHLKYRPDIDGLRAVAVLSVVIFHYFPSILPGGFVGVDIFFVISGYLITSIILKSASSNSFSYVEFYKRRILRIFPALSIVLISCIIIGWVYFFQDD